MLFRSRVFPMHSPRIDSIDVVRRGRVRRAKLYYLRGLTGKRARIAEKQDHRRVVRAKGESKAKNREAKAAAASASGAE